MTVAIRISNDIKLFQYHETRLNITIYADLSLSLNCVHNFRRMVTIFYITMNVA